MREKISRLATGNVIEEELLLEISPAELSGCVRQGNVFSGSFTVKSRDKGIAKGLVYTSNRALSLQKSSFGGTVCRVGFEVDAAGASVGDEIRGTIHLVTNGGEKHIPFSYTVVSQTGAPLPRRIKTAADFLALFLEDMDAAAQLFVSEEFKKLPFMDSARAQLYHNALRKCPDAKNSCEEFLIAMGQKEPARIQSTDRICIALENGQDGFLLPVKKQGAGYLRLAIESRDPALRTAKQIYCMEDDSMSVGVKADRIPENGLRTSIRLCTARQCLEIPVDIKRADSRQKDEISMRSGKNISAYLRQRFIVFCEGEEKCSARTMKKLDAEISRLEESEEDGLVPAILRAEYFLLCGEKEKAAGVLEPFRGDMARRRTELYTEYCWYIYLQLVSTDRTDQLESLIALVKKYMEEGDKNGLLYVLFTRLVPERLRVSKRNYDWMEDLCKDGCTSPALYFHAQQMLENDPHLATEPDAFFLQVINFAMKHGDLSADLKNHAAALFAQDKKEADGLRRRVLCALYDRNPDKVLLAAICRQLIQSKDFSEDCFIWFKQALDAGIRLSGLYEFYIYTLPGDYDRLLPREILLYFSYDNRLPDDACIRLYLNIIRFMDRTDTLYRQYEHVIGQFTMKLLLSKRADEAAAQLYDRVLFPEMLDETAAMCLKKVLDTRRVTVKNPYIKSIVLHYEELLEEYPFRLDDGSVCADVFLLSGQISFQSVSQNRYFGLDADVTRILDTPMSRSLGRRLPELCAGNRELELERGSLLLKEGVLVADDASLLRRLASDARLSPRFRKSAAELLLAYIFPDGGAARGCDADMNWVMSLEPGALDAKWRARIFETMAERGLFTKAYRQIVKYGFDMMDGQSLTDIADALILRNEKTDKAEFTEFVFELFKHNIFDTVTLDYLCENYNGLSEDMYRLLVEAESLHAYTADLPERLLVQLLFTGSTLHIDDVFDRYMQGSKRSELLLHAFFSLRAGKYIFSDEELKDQVAEYLEKTVENSQPSRVPVLYLLALLKKYSFTEELSPEQKKLAGDILNQLLAEGRIFPWMKRLSRHIRVPEEVTNKTMAEYRTSPAAEPSLYILGEDGRYSRGELIKVYAGVYMVCGILFDGDELHYRITEENTGRQELKAEGVLKADGTGTGEYARLMDMQKALRGGRDDELKNKMLKYIADEAVLDMLFEDEKGTENGY